MVRDKAAEKALKNLPWPDRTGPFWKACNATEQLLEETVADAGSAVLDEQVLDRDKSDVALRSALGRVQSFLRHGVLDRVRTEASLSSVWGENLPRAIRSYGRHGGGDLSQFTHGVQQEMQRAWQPEAVDSYGLGRVFPNFGRLEESVDAVIGCGWPAAPDTLESHALPGPEKARERVARLFLYTLLRTGGPQ